MGGAADQSPNASSVGAQAAVPLPAPPRAGLLLLLAVGALLLGYAAAVDLGPARITWAGLGLTIASFVVAILLNREAPASIRVDGAAKHWTVAGRDGSEARIPFEAIERVEVNPNLDNRARHGVWLHQKSGGRIELARYRRRPQADALVEYLRSALARATEEASSRSDSGAAPAGSPEDRLAQARLLEFHRGSAEPSLRISWPTARPVKATIPSLVGAAGVALVAVGMHHQGVALAPVAGVGAVALALTIALISGLRHQLGVTESIHIDEEQLSVERRRGTRLLRRESAPLSALSAIDCAHTFDALSGSLVVRVSDHAAETDPPSAELRVPLGPLPLADRINLDLTVSEEVARRRDRDV